MLPVLAAEIFKNLSSAFSRGILWQDMGSIFLATRQYHKYNFYYENGLHTFL